MVIFTQEIARIVDLIEVLRKEAHSLNMCALKLEKDMAEVHYTRLHSKLLELNKEVANLGRRADEYKRERGE
jgi:hypothetical protein